MISAQGFLPMILGTLWVQFYPDQPLMYGGYMLIVLGVVHMALDVLLSVLRLIKWVFERRKDGLL